MTCAAIQRLEIYRRGFWLRCFLMSIALAATVLFGTARASARTDCPLPANLTVPTVQGQVFDVTGKPLSGAVVALEAKNGAQWKATTGASGQFRLDAPPGNYKLRAFYPNFQSIATTLTVENSPTANQEHTLYIVLGLQGSYCSFVTTSKKEFDKLIRANKKRLRETAHPDATQK